MKVRNKKTGVEYTVVALFTMVGVGNAVLIESESKEFVGIEEKAFVEGSEITDVFFGEEHNVFASLIKEMLKNVPVDQRPMMPVAMRESLFPVESDGAKSGE